MASRMTPAKYETTSVKIDGNGHRFTVAASKVIFDGFMSVYTMDDEDKAENRTLAKSIDKDTKLSLKEFDGEQHLPSLPHIIQKRPLSGRWKNWVSVVPVPMHRRSRRSLHVIMSLKKTRTCM